MESERYQSHLRLIEEMKKMAEELHEVDRLSKTLASKTEKIKTANAASTDHLMSSLKMKMNDTNLGSPSRLPSDNPFTQSPESDISEIVVAEVERQLRIEMDLAAAYRELEDKSRKLKQSAAQILPLFSPDGDFGQLPMVHAVTNYHNAVAAASRNFDRVPAMTKKLLQDLWESNAPETGDLSVLKDKLRQQYEILRRAKGRFGNRGETTTTLDAEPSLEDLESAGWQCFGKK